MFAVNWKEDSSCEILGRVTARNGSGEYTGVPGEGRYITQADVESITAKLYNLTQDPDKEDPEDIVVDPVTTVLNVHDETEEVWIADDTGYNFRHHLPPETFPNGGDVYRLEYRFELEGGFVFHEVFEGPSENIHSS